MARVCIFSLTILSGLSCGDNVFKGLDTSTAEDATKALEQGNPQKAVTLLLEVLGSSFRSLYFILHKEIADGNTETIRTQLGATVERLINGGSIEEVPALVSILSSAHAKIYGIDPFDIALAMATDEEEEEGEEAATLALTLASGGNDLTALFPVLPEATTANINGLTAARMILDSIGTANFTAEDSFKMALYLTANVSFVTKQLDDDGDGQLSPIEANDLTPENADIVLDLLVDAADSVLISGDKGNTKAADSAKKITGIQEKILNSEGADNTAKVKSYLGAKPASQ